MKSSFSATANSEASTQFNFSAPQLISYQACVSKLGSSLNDLNWPLHYNHFARTTQKTQPLLCWEGVLTSPLHSNLSYSIFACVFVVARMCLPSRCLAMNVCSAFAIPALVRHVTILTFLRKARLYHIGPRVSIKFILYVFIIHEIHFRT
jgi:hypothetical protein